jgi:hypothetical protein
MNQVAMSIVNADAISAYNRASIGDVCSHLTSPEPNGTKHGAKKNPQMRMNNPDLQRILQIEYKPEMMLDIKKLTFQCISNDEAS